MSIVGIARGVASTASSSSTLRRAAIPRRAFHSTLRPFHSTPRADRALRVLGLESSADDACAAIVTSDRQVLANVVCKQHDINKKWGGIHPIAAHEAHLRDMVGAQAPAGVCSWRVQRYTLAAPLACPSLASLLSRPGLALPQPAR